MEIKKLEHKKIARCLMGAGLAAGVGGCAVFIFYLLSVGQMRGLFSSLVLVLILLGMCSLALLYALALWEYLRISIRIGEDRSFCKENAKGLSRISRYLFLAAGVWVISQGAALLPGIGPGSWWVAFLLFAVASGAMGGLSWAIGRLLSHAVQLQEENDLTV